MGRHVFTRKEAQAATRKRANTPKDRLYTRSRKTDDGRYVYLYEGKWMTRQAISQHRKAACDNTNS